MSSTVPSTAPEVVRQASAVHGRWYYQLELPPRADGTRGGPAHPARGHPAAQRPRRGCHPAAGTNDGLTGRAGRRSPGSSGRVVSEESSEP